MEQFEESVWAQHEQRRKAGVGPAASLVSAALSAFPTLMQRRGRGRDDVALVFRLADWMGNTIPAPATSAQPLPPTVVTNIDGVSAAELLVLTPERVPDVLGRVINKFDHGNFTDKQGVAWVSAARQILQPPHTQLWKQDDVDFMKFIECDDPVPTNGVREFFRRKWAQLPNEHPEWKYKDSDNVRRRYQRLEKYKEQMGLSSKRNV